MKVLVVSDLWQPFPGGAERLMFNLARDLMRRGEDVTVLTGYLEAEQFDGPPVIINDSIGVFSDRDAGAEIVSRVIAEVSPDVILTHHLYASQFKTEMIGSGVPFVQVVLNGQRIPEAGMAVFISKWVREAGEPLPGDMLITPPVFDDVVAEIHGDAIGFIKPIEHKGVKLVYEIAAALPDRRFLILRGEWQDLEIIEAHPNVEFMEPVADIRDFYRECRILLVPSLSEDAGTVAQEATVNGLVCISSDRQGLAETNAGGVTLYPGDPVAWVRWIEELDDPMLYASIVDRQVEYLESVGQAARLDEFAARLGAMKSSGCV